jgi:nucleotidyltransferase substrate binding protein (TIGR01987 family)
MIPGLESEDIRWKQRFNNFEKTLAYLEDAIKITNPDFTHKAGIIQLFEISFELSWNVLKDYLEEQGFSELKYPRESIKKAFETGLIQDGHLWLTALKNRNLTAHTYDEEMADKVVADIKQNYFPMLTQLYHHLKMFR